MRYQIAIELAQQITHVNNNVHGIHQGTRDSAQRERAHLVKRKSQNAIKVNQTLLFNAIQSDARAQDGSGLLYSLALKVVSHKLCPAGH